METEIITNKDFYDFFFAVNLSFSCVSIPLFLWFYYESTSLCEKRDAILNVLLNEVINTANGMQVCFNHLTDRILKELHKPQMRILFGSIEPSGFKYSTILFL